MRAVPFAQNTVSAWPSGNGAVRSGLTRVSQVFKALSFTHSARLNGAPDVSTSSWLAGVSGLFVLRRQAARSQVSKSNRTFSSRSCAWLRWYSARGTHVPPSSMSWSRHMGVLHAKMSPPAFKNASTTVVDCAGRADASGSTSRSKDSMVSFAGSQSSPNPNGTTWYPACSRCSASMSRTGSQSSEAGVTSAAV